jgi:protocatechuate 4,5-dioxygenase beta chain
MALLWPKPGARPVRTIPVAINTVQFPLPSPARCSKLGKAIGRAIESFDDERSECKPGRAQPSSNDLRVVVIATGGLSHQLDGTRAGFINKEFDKTCLEKIVSDPEWLTQYSAHDLVRDAGAQGVELLMWFVMRGAMTGRVTEKHRSYHIPISNTAAAVMVLENNEFEIPTDGGVVTASMNERLRMQAR